MGRNAAELRRDAIATGLFDGPTVNFVGDGYSVPWQVAIPGASPQLNLTLWAYKQYLDANYLEYSRLHDWLYTPYGATINATREEADDALVEELGRDSPVDAAIVGAAVRYFGEPYFGHTSTGYVGGTAQVFGNNMPEEPTPTVANRESYSMPTKVVILFQMTTTKNVASERLNYAPVIRTAGWSESFSGPDSISSVLQLLKGPRSSILPLLPARAALLPSEASIIGVRLYSGGAGRGQLLAAAYSGNQGLLTDQPSTSLLCSATSTVSGVTRRFNLRCIPDFYVKSGEFSPDVAYADALIAFFASLSGFGWQAKTYTNSRKVFEIDADGTVTLDGTNPFTQAQQVTLKNVYLTGLKVRGGGKFSVLSIGPWQNQFKLAKWTLGEATGGQAFIQGGAFVEFDTAIKSVVRATTRKVGRPFAGYRGRNSPRNKV